ncbi:MAG: hypothetical protein ACR2JC_12055 [Chloroflexota bacterium]
MLSFIAALSRETWRKNHVREINARSNQQRVELLDHIPARVAPASGVAPAEAGTIVGVSL